MGSTLRFPNVYYKGAGVSEVRLRAGLDSRSTGNATVGVSFNGKNVANCRIPEYVAFVSCAQTQAHHGEIEGSTGSLEVVLTLEGPEGVAALVDSFSLH